MDALATLAIGLEAVALAALGTTVVTGYRLQLGPALARRRAMRSLGREVQRLADEHVARPEPRRRHSAHCPACGRFARVTSSGPRGTWTRCTAHGVRLRAVRRIGRAETPLVELIKHRPLVPFPTIPHVPLVPMLEAIRPNVRVRDWLDDPVLGGRRRAALRIAA